MKRYRRVAILYVKKDWGSGRLTWRPALGNEEGQRTIRRVSNRKAKEIWYHGNSVKSY